MKTNHTDPKLLTRWAAIEEAIKAGVSDADLAKLMPPLLTVDSTKTKKGEKYGILTGIMYLSPATEAGIEDWTACPHSTPECRAVCLGHSSGKLAMRVGGGIGNHKRARILRTWLWGVYPNVFYQLLRREVGRLWLQSLDKKMRLFIRLNGSSDLSFEFTVRRICNELPEAKIVFYDYTKNMDRAYRSLVRGDYHCTYSYRGTEQYKELDAMFKFLELGGNVAVVFAGKELPRTWLGYRVVDGDLSDGRPDDDHGVIVGLRAKGAARKAKTGKFVRIGVSK